MKKDSTQQEILLFTTTTFSQRELSDNNGQDGNRLFKTAKEQWKEGCWNGLLADLLPEICEQSSISRKLFLWNVYEGDFYLALEMGEQLAEPEAELSINPAVFVPAINEN